MKIRFRLGSRSSTSQHVSQEVSFLYSFMKPIDTTQIPTEKDYDELMYIPEETPEEKNIVLALNYNSDMYLNDQLYPCTGLTQVDVASYRTVSVYKQEIWDGGRESVLHPVAIDMRETSLRDFNIANGRTYEYYILPRGNVGESAAARFVIATNWQDWSLTELHPVAGEPKRYSADLSDVWVFKYNVEIGEQSQNISKTQQDNLTAYPRFSRGQMNNVGSSVTALLGSEMLPYSFVTKQRKYNPTTGVWEEQDSPGVTGGYTERLQFVSRLTSNQAIDMLQAWRQVAFSGNPKLIKDRKGQKFIAQITSSSNTVSDTWRKKPDSITFNWVEVQGMDDVIITSEYTT